MSDDDIDWDREFADDPDYQAMTPEQRRRLLAVMERMIDLGMAAVYGDEEDGLPEARVDCTRCIPRCRAKCCTLIFALTKAEVAAGHVRHNPRRPYFIVRDEDGYCPHLDRATLACTIWERRPLRCRRYDCRKDSNIWPRGVPVQLVPAFPGLGGGDDDGQ
ncbi:MAG: YkgJ family cysteine cluster protein [Gammaproteobacteria bacterium]